MGIFSKKKQSAEPSQPTVPVASFEGAVVITAMPEKFLTADAPRFWTARKLWSVAVFFILVLIAGVYWLLTSERFAPKPPATKPAATAPAPVAPAVSTSTNTLAIPENANSPAPTTGSPLGVPLSNSPAPSDVNAPAGTEPVLIAPPTTTVSEGALVLPPTNDTDVDGLTDAEEQVWHTDLARPDTDSDGYTDLEELLHGYNPIGPGRLAQSSLVKTYTALNQSILEFVSLTTQPNSNNLPIADWYASVVPGTSATAVTTQTLGGVTGVLSPDQRTFYFTPAGRPGDVLVVNYSIGTKTETNFASTFRVIVANLTLAPVP